MKVVIRDLGTGWYLGMNWTWVRDIRDAEEFGTLEAAGAKARETGRRKVVVVLRYQKPACELALDVAFCLPNAPGEGQRASA